MSEPDWWPAARTGRKSEGENFRVERPGPGSVIIWRDGSGYSAIKQWLGEARAVVYLRGMSDGQFTTKATVLWGAIPKEARERILANVFCVKCRDSVTITKFIGEEVKGDVILKGFCARCGHEVVRVVETSERDNSGN